MNKKRNIIMFSLVLSLLVISYLLINRDSIWESKKSNGNHRIMFAMYIDENEDGNWKIYNGDKIPEGYRVNTPSSDGELLSRCENREGRWLDMEQEILFEWDNVTNELVIESNETMFCHLYLEKNNSGGTTTEPEEPIVVDASTPTVSITASDKLKTGKTHTVGEGKTITLTFTSCLAGNVAPTYTIKKGTNQLSPSSPTVTTENGNKCIKNTLSVSVNDNGSTYTLTATNPNDNTKTADTEYKLIIVESNSGSVITIDKPNAPTITPNKEATNGVHYTDSVSFTLSGSKINGSDSNVEYYYKYENGSWNPGRSFSRSKSEGNTTISAKACNSSYTMSEESCSGEVSYDLKFGSNSGGNTGGCTADTCVPSTPTITATDGVGSGGWHNYVNISHGYVGLNYTSTIQNGSYIFKCDYGDQDIYRECGSTYEFNGSIKYHDIKVKACNSKSPNICSGVSTYVIRVDVGFPTITNISVPSNGTITATVSDGADSLASGLSTVCVSTTSTSEDEIPSNCSSGSSSGSTYTFSGLDITKTYYIYASDKAGNVSNGSGRIPRVS